LEGCIIEEKLEGSEAMPGSFRASVNFRESKAPRFLNVFNRTNISANLLKN
jgi:hypothetical protein